MDNKLLILFIVLNIVNVVVQTIKSICTIKCEKVVAAIVNAVAYGLYTVVTIYMLCDLPLMWKAFIVAMCNLVGVYVVKLIEEHARKDKLWKVEMTVPKKHFEEVCAALRIVKVPYNYVDIEKYVLVNCYCATQQDSIHVKDFMKNYDVKYFVSESKTL